jgi:hypothetical protein
LITVGCIYVDKTKEIHRLVNSNAPYFLSRPRRFGKSLLVSTLEALFKGQKTLFEGLYIYDKWDWEQQYPVIRLDFGGITNNTLDALTNSLSDFVKEIASTFDVVLEKIELSDRFAELINKLHQSTGRQVVVLVDEYDKPITDHLSNMEVAEANRKALHDFYQVLKAADEHLRFVFLTGVSKFSGVSVFSALNNLNDITLDDKYASICGYTQEELENCFSEYLDDVAQHLALTKNDLLTLIRKQYNGYSWNGSISVYNPFSTLLFFDKRRFANYWFRTGTPTFLVELLKTRNQVEAILEPIEADESVFDSYDPVRIGEIPLLFQTGYLTVKHRETGWEKTLYRLELPNLEVKEALLNHLLGAYSQYPVDQLLPLSFKMQRQIREGDAEGLERNLRMMLSCIPNILHIKSEAYYHSLFLLWMKVMGFDIQGEVMTNIGRIDAVWSQPEWTVIAEVKFHTEKDADSLLNEAMAQIYDRRYYEPYLDKKVRLMAVAFTGKEVKCRMETIL